MLTENYKSIIVDETELAKRLKCDWLKGCKLFNQNIRTEANKQIMIDKNGNVIGAKISKKDEIPGVFLDKYNGYKYIRLHNGGPIALHIAMKFVFFDEIECVHSTPLPTDVVDHINGIKTDNQLSNLRLVSKRINCYNCERKFKNIVNKLPNDVSVLNNTKHLKQYKSDSEKQLFIEITSNYYYKLNSVNNEVIVPKWLSFNRENSEIIKF